jgi:hypothetical protein
MLVFFDCGQNLLTPISGISSNDKYAESVLPAFDTYSFGIIDMKVDAEGMRTLGWERPFAET